MNERRTPNKFAVEVLTVAGWVPCPTLTRLVNAYEMSWGYYVKPTQVVTAATVLGWTLRSPGSGRFLAQVPLYGTPDEVRIRGH